MRRDKPKPPTKPQPVVIRRLGGSGGRRFKGEITVDPAATAEARYGPPPATDPPPAALTVRPVEQLVHGFEPSAAQAAQSVDLLSRSRAKNTNRAYSTGWKHWCRWASANHCPSLPAEPKALVSYVAECEAKGERPPTIGQRIAAIAATHRTAGFDPSPTKTELVVRALSAIRRTAPRPTRQAAAISIELLERMLARLPAEGLHGLRDRAILLVGWAGAMRRSELAGLQWRELVWGPIEHRADAQPLFLRVCFDRSTKGDQERGAEVVLARNDSNAKLCPVRALRAWLHASGIAEGPVFRGWQGGGKYGAVLGSTPIEVGAVNDLIKKLAGACGEDPLKYSAHSLRAGFLTEAFRLGIRMEKILDVSRHKDVKTALGYRRISDPLKDSAAGEIWGPKKGEP